AVRDPGSGDPDDLQQERRRREGRGGGGALLARGDAGAVEHLPGLPWLAEVLQPGCDSPHCPQEPQH
ncbi:unnamed protein product, partial [Ectocarpus sp. 4 AP-2014]